ncbi:hypothetical protein Q8A73_006704 [Channa argus]|nr:hypothetical protein Q8A73_006704 [Channa argus]
MSSFCSDSSRLHVVWFTAAFVDDLSTQRKKHSSQAETVFNGKHFPAVSGAFMDSPYNGNTSLQTSTSNLNAGYSRPSEAEDDGKVSSDTIWLWIAVLATIGNIVVVAVSLETQVFAVDLQVVPNQLSLSNQQSKVFLHLAAGSLYSYTEVNSNIAAVLSNHQLPGHKCQICTKHCGNDKVSDSQPDGESLSDLEWKQMKRKEEEEEEERSEEGGI